MAAALRADAEFVRFCETHLTPEERRGVEYVSRFEPGFCRLIRAGATNENPRVLLIPRRHARAMFGGASAYITSHAVDPAFIMHQLWPVIAATDAPHYHVRRTGEIVRVNLALSHDDLSDSESCESTSSE